MAVGAFFAVFALFYAVMGLFRPHWAFALVVFLFPIKQVLQSYFTVLITNQGVFNAFVALAAGFAALLRIQRDGMDVRSYFNVVTYATLGLYTMVFLGLWYTPAPDYANSMFFAAIPYHVLYIFVTPLLLRNLEEFRRAILPVVIGGSIVGVGILINPKAIYHQNRLTLNLGQDLGSSEYLGNVLAIADMGSTIAVFAALMVPDTGKRYISLIRIGGIVAGLGIAVASGSRGQVIAAILVSVLFYALARKIKNPAQFVGTIAGLGVLGGVLYGVFKVFSGGNAAGRWSGSFTGEGSGVDDRLNRILMSLNSYLSSPGNYIQGLGTSSYAVNVGLKQEGSYPHNLLVEVFCDYGLIGSTCLTLTLVFGAYFGRRLWMQYRDDPVCRSTAVVIMGHCLFLFIVSLKQGSLVNMATPFWGLLVLARIATEENYKFAAAAKEAQLAREWGDPQLAAQYDESYAYDAVYSPTHPYTSPHSPHQSP